MQIKRFLQEMLVAIIVLGTCLYALIQILHAISWVTGFAEITVERTFAYFVPLIALIWISVSLGLFNRIALVVPGLVTAALIPILDDFAGRRHPLFLEIFVEWYGHWWQQLAFVLVATGTLGYWSHRRLNT